MDPISFINAYVFGPALTFSVFGAGIFLLVKTRFFFFAHPVRVFGTLFRSKNRAEGVSPFGALCTALAGTLGVGNIVGVSGAVALGGAGAVFWMWVSSAAAMVLKYAEVALGVKYRRAGADGYHGGAPYYIRDAAGKPRLARIFAILCVAASFTLGNSVQARAAADAGSVTLGIHPAATGAVIAAVCLAVSFGGVKRIASFTVKLIPFLTLVFIIMSVASVISARERIPAVFAEIFSSAFTPSSAGGGIAGFLLSRSLRYGIARGIASNEAGCGTAPTAHAAADVDSPAKQGIWGIVEVAVDTVFLCTLTALVILVNGTSGGEGIAPVLDGFSACFGRAAGYIVCACVFFFALSTVLCWSFYGCEAIASVTASKRAKRVYLTVFFFAVIPFSLADTVFLWEISDLVISLMTVINVAVLISRRREIAEITRGEFGGNIR